jgi:hypothetical protein
MSAVRRMTERGRNFKSKRACWTFGCPQKAPIPVFSFATVKKNNAGMGWFGQKLADLTFGDVW